MSSDGECCRVWTVTVMFAAASFALRPAPGADFWAPTRAPDQLTWQSTRRVPGTVISSPSLARLDVTIDKLSTIILFCVCPGVRGIPYPQQTGTWEFTQIQSRCRPGAEPEFGPRPDFPQHLSSEPRHYYLNQRTMSVQNRVITNSDSFPSRPISLPCL